MEMGFVSPNCLTLSEKRTKLSQMDDDLAMESRDFLTRGAEDSLLSQDRGQLFSVPGL